VFRPFWKLRKLRSDLIKQLRINAVTKRAPHGAPFLVTFAENECNEI